MRSPALATWLPNIRGASSCSRRHAAESLRPRFPTAALNARDREQRSNENYVQDTRYPSYALRRRANLLRAQGQTQHPICDGQQLRLRLVPSCRTSDAAIGRAQVMKPVIASAVEHSIAEDGSIPLVLPRELVPLFRQGAEQWTDPSNPERQHHICAVLRQLAAEVGRPVVVLDVDGNVTLTISPESTRPLPWRCHPCKLNVTKGRPCPGCGSEERLTPPKRG